MSLPTEQLLLERFMKLSIATAVATIALKVIAAAVTGSVGFLSDALESGASPEAIASMASSGPSGPEEMALIATTSLQVWLLVSPWFFAA